MNTEKRKTLWILSKRFDLLDNGNTKPSEKLFCISIKETYGSDTVVGQIRNTLDLHDVGIVLKLRNSRNSLVPINSRLIPNSKFIPYTLEVVRAHQFVEPTPKCAKNDIHNEAFHDKLSGLHDRITVMEECMNDPERKEIIRKNTEQSLNDLEKQLEFLNKRFDEADSIGWSGMFKKPPLW